MSPGYRIVLVSLSALCFSLLAGCGTTSSPPDGGVADVSEAGGDSVEGTADGVGSGDSTATDGMSDEADTWDAADSGTPPASLAWCTPQPKPPVWAAAPDVLAMLAEAEASGCEAVSLDVDVDGDGTDESTLALPTLPCGDGCAEHLPGFASTWSGPSIFSFGEDHLRALVEGRLLDNGEREFLVHLRQEGSTKQETYAYRFSAAGELLNEQRDWTGVVNESTTLTWTDGRLTALTKISNEVTHAADMTWTYDPAGRLTDATIDWNGSTLAATWTYDTTGRPLSVIRTVDGADWVAQTWTWSATGALESRTASIEHDTHWGGPPATDHHPVQLPVLFDGPTWSDSLPTALDDCQRAPTSIQHGYPPGEHVWELGWPLEDRPGGMGFDYAYNGYAYYYGSTAWYGHGGVAGGLLALANGDSTDVTIIYDTAGRLLEETTTRVTPATDPTTEVRTRQYAADGTLSTDTRTWTLNDATATTAFAFTYGPAGRLLSRDYHLDDVLVARHTWTWDAAGRVTSHGIAHSPSATTSIAQEWYEGPGGASLDGLPPEPPLHFVHERTYSADGTTVTWKKWDAVSDTSVVTEIHRDLPLPDGGRRVEVEIGSSLSHVLYDAHGRRLESSDDHDNDGSPDRAATYTYLQADAPTSLLLRFEHTSATPAEPSQELYTATCD